MRLSVAFFVLSSSVTSTAAFVIPTTGHSAATTSLFGYLDDLTRELNAPSPDPDVQAMSREATQLGKEDVDRFGVGSWDGFVDFNEFDGGDGQMGVAGDGKKGLQQDWTGGAELVKSKSMSAKNAWGKSTGYADQLVDQGVDETRAQQLENWMNQREIVEQRNQQKTQAASFDKVSVDEDWRKLSSFGVERTQDFDLDHMFGEVLPGSKIEGVIEITSRLNQAKIFEFSLKSPFMGFADFRARFTSNTGLGWSVTPEEGSFNGRGPPTPFTVKFRPEHPGLSEGYLVVQTEDDKWTWQVLGTGSM